MVPFTHLLAGRGLRSPRVAIGVRRLYSSNATSDQTRFSYFFPAHTEADYGHIFAKLEDSGVLTNTDGHDAAVILATPNFARQLEDSDLVSRFAKALCGSSDVTEFHVLCAIVDHVTPALGESGKMHGFSILRGRLHDTLPELWLPSPPRSREDMDSVSALTFNLGNPSVTLPLARTTFQNNRASTLLTSRFDMTQGTAKLAQSGEKYSQCINILLDEPPRSTADLGLWAPLSPITRARVVTESFGNIIRGVEVDGKSQPASTELEDSVDTMFKYRTSSDATPGPMGVWAMVSPVPEPDNAPDPTPILQGKGATRDAVEITAQYIEEEFGSGGYLFQILSGGGGWGAKKGLLSLDPQRTHFSLSEEEEMTRFMQTMENSGFAPAGSQIQFYVPAQAPEEDTTTKASGVVFGVPGEAETSKDAEIPAAGYLVDGHFGGLSSRGVFISAPPKSEAGVAYESKLSAPNSRVFAGKDGGEGSGLLGFLGAGELADAGTIALMQ
ncbi:6-phosphogluconate dehydrogenase [Purpureocillium lavendulum]|uniref:6-phosphogluconate dehydrogenase n=1 Tax=Purpureocillium lavendulum TaxID=1247861 RepID=A0AB34G4A7_9HYPO|nr:6-phosphogluconate dehydrogenase [Purpureocillium lavendulum]